MRNIDTFIDEIIPISVDYLNGKITDDDFNESDIPNFSDNREMEKKIALALYKVVAYKLEDAITEYKKAKIQYEVTTKMLDSLKRLTKDSASLEKIEESLSSSNEKFKIALDNLNAAQSNEDTVYRAFDKYMENK